MQKIIQDIRKQCRMAMNGIASTSMRKRGLAYKLNFGLMINQIKELAANYKPNSELAETLWKEDTRELKIMATLLYPIDEFKEESANRWVTQIANQEVREQVCINLFQQLHYAKDIAIEWSNNSNADIRTTGYWLFARLFLSKKLEKNLPLDAVPFIWQDVITENMPLRNAALLVLKYIGRQSKELADIILNKLAVHKEDSDLLKQETYNSLAFEFEYFYEG